MLIGCPLNSLDQRGNHEKNSNIGLSSDLRECTTRIFADHASSWPRSKRGHSRRYNPYADSSEHRRRRSEPRYSPWD
jgi:hypothetical protein